MRPRIRISFSGGRTSALMTKLIHDRLRDTHDILTTFANTGSEHAETLVFVDRCDREWGWGVVWLEAVINPEEGAGVTSRVVTYETASRKDEPFEAYCRKYGIPNMVNPACTTRLKELPMDHYCHHVVGWKRGEYDTAIGIRWDEADRIDSKRHEKRIIYPLVDAKVTKPDVLAFWRRQSFDLQLKGEHYGNCTWCWKKSLRKHLTLAVEAPEVFDFPARMERECGHIKAAGYAATGPDGRRHFFREHRDTTDIFMLAAYPFVPYADAATNRQGMLFDFDPDLDVGSACGESCEIGADT